MSSPNHIIFELLKKEIANTYSKTYPSCITPIEDWKGQDIINLQEELIKKVKGRISEKWFYTHIKTKGEKLPRIDMLNMLSQYAEYQDWNDFTIKKRDFTTKIEDKPTEITSEPVIPPVEEEKKVEIFESPANKKRKIWIVSGSFLLIIILVLFIAQSRKTYRCCFTNLNGQALVPNSRIEVNVLNDHESPILIACDDKGCFEFKTNKESIRFVVRSPYYKTDTIIRLLDGSFKEERIKLQTNDYALMIHYFSTSNIKDWKKRKTQLQDMIAYNAKIYQVYTDGSGMELYNKNEFINKLTMPLKSLKNIEIIETHYSGNKISLLRFVQQEPDK